MRLAPGKPVGSWWGGREQEVAHGSRRGSAAELGVVVGVVFEGAVVGEPLEAGVWVRTAERDLVFLRLLGGGKLLSGQRVSGTGILRFDEDGRVRDWLIEAELAERGGLIGGFFIETTADRIESQ